MPRPNPMTVAYVDVSFTGPVVNLLTTNHGPNDRKTPARLVLRQPAPDGVSQAQPNDTIKATKPVDLVYCFPDSSIRPLGIAFKADAAGMPEVTLRGDLNLPYENIRLEQPQGNSANQRSAIRVANFHTRPDGDNGTTPYSWEYFIFFQTADGVIGMIDPDVENDY